MCICGVARAARISIHAAREGGDLEELGLAYDFDEISIHAAREGGDILVAALVNRQAISIHAAREGGDFSLLHFCHNFDNFNPRRP